MEFRWLIVRIAWEGDEEPRLQWRPDSTYNWADVPTVIMTPGELEKEGTRITPAEPERQPRPTSTVAEK